MRPICLTPSMRAATAACAIALASCASDGVRLATTPVHPYSFDGHWVVDPSRSEDPDAAGAAAGGGRGGMGGGHGHGGGMGGGGMGGGGMGGGRHSGGAGPGRGPGGSPDSGGNGNTMRRALLLPDTLDIALRHDTLSLTADGHPRSVPMVTTQDAHADATRAGWDGDSLVIVIHADPKRGDIVQRYEVAPDHSRLVVTTEFKGKSKKVSVVREFTAAPAATKG